MKKAFRLFALASFILTSFVSPAYADNIGLIFQGVARTLVSVFQIPKTMLEYSSEFGFPVGTVMGTVIGSLQTVFGTLGGMADVARGAAPYAKYLVFLV